jgi:hypothetical protein
MRLLQKTSSSVLCELAVRVYVGNRQIPRDEAKSRELLELAELNARTQKDQDDVLYYNLLVKRYDLTLSQNRAILDQEGREASLQDIN